MYGKKSSKKNLTIKNEKKKKTFSHFYGKIYNF